MCVCVMPACVYGYHTHAWHPRRPEDSIPSPGNWCYRQLWVAMQALGNEPRSSARVARAFNRQVISPTLWFCLFEAFISSSVWLKVWWFCLFCFPPGTAFSVLDLYWCFLAPSFLLSPPLRTPSVLIVSISFLLTLGSLCSSLALRSETCLFGNALPFWCSCSLH